MSESLRERYDAVPYRHGAVADSHPARIGFIARLMGTEAAAPDCCRVLELGCGEGMNLLPLAERFPASEFVGIDLSPAQIATGEEARSACGITNARLLCADLREWEPELEAFDFVIAHGVYSWVPCEVKDRLLAVCERALAPRGVAYVSYNTLPGWGLLAGLRRFLRGETSHEPNPQAQLDRAALALDALARALEGQPGTHAALMRETLAEMQGKPAALLFHDELAPVNDPCTFAEFTNHAASHGLHYLAEAHYATMPFDHVPATARAALAPLGLDVIRAQQFMDVLFPRFHRNSLLCRAALPTSKGDLRVMQSCAIGSRLQFAGSVPDFAPAGKLALLAPNGVATEIISTAERAFVLALIAAAPARVPFSAALAKANATLREHSLPTADPAALCRLLYQLFTIDGVDLLLAGDGGWLGEGRAPSPLMRFQAARGFPVTNRWHEPVALTGEAASVIAAPASEQDFAGLALAGLLL